MNAIESATLIVIAPSNPLVSIAPILAVGGVQEAISAARSRGVQVIGVSPIVAGKALKGPADRMLHAAGLPSSPVGVARALPGLFDTLLVEESDLTDVMRNEMAPLVPRVIGVHSIMHDDASRLALAERILEIAEVAE
jgi:LPPG:FO 2-phospho-L-lactate transferase